MKWLALLLLVLLASPALADSTDEEIDYLLNSIGKSGCKFVRNGKSHSARKAREHLRSKKRRNARAH